MAPPDPESSLLLGLGHVHQHCHTQMNTEVGVETRAGRCSSWAISSDQQLICILCSEPGKVLEVMYPATNKPEMALLYIPVKKESKYKDVEYVKW